MHVSSRIEMCIVINQYLGDRYKDNLHVIDVGSFDVNGSYRDIIPFKWHYLGIDLRPGKNVDIIMDNPCKMPIDDSSSDLVISGQCLEHCQDPFKLMKEMARVVAQDGFVIATAPCSWPEHSHPKDYWRFMPDGMKEIMEQAELTVLSTYISDVSRGNTKGLDCWGIATKVI